MGTRGRTSGDKPFNTYVVARVTKDKRREWLRSAPTLSRRGWCQSKSRGEAGKPCGTLTPKGAAHGAVRVAPDRGVFVCVCVTVPSELVLTGRPLFSGHGVQPHSHAQPGKREVTASKDLPRSGQREEEANTRRAESTSNHIVCKRPDFMLWMSEQECIVYVYPLFFSHPSMDVWAPTWN